VEMQAVESKMFRAVGYDSETKTFRVEYVNGITWEYRDLPQELHQQFQQSESKGKFFNQHIRSNPRYPSAKVEQPVAAGVASGE
jgi:hypothetical protein